MSFSFPDPATIDRDEIPAALLAVAALATALATRLVAEPTATATATATPEYMDVDAAAKRLGVSRRYLFRHAKRLPFVRRLSRKRIVCDEARLTAYIASRRA